MIHIPSSLNHPNILDEEIEAYYAIKCVRDADYDFEKQFHKIITEYVDGIKFPSKGARRSFKSQLKKMVLVDKPKNSKKYSAFQQWRLRQIEFHKNKQRDMLMKKPKNTTIDVDKLLITINEKDKIIEQLMKENEELNQRYASLNQRYASLKAQLADQKPQEEFIEDEKNFITSDDDEEEEVVFTDDESEPEQPEPEPEQPEPEPETEEESEEESEEEPETEEESEEEEAIEKFEKEDEVRPIEGVKRQATKEEAIELFQKDCIKMIDQYHEEYMKLKTGKTNMEIIKINNDINIRFSEEVVDFYLNKLDDIFNLPCDEYEQLHKKSMDKLKDRITYFSE